MTDETLVFKKLAYIEGRVALLVKLARPEEMASDEREAAFIQHTLQLAIQAAIDVASVVISERRLGEPSTSRAMFDILERNGWLSTEETQRLKAMVGFRNIIVHGYADVNLELVKSVVKNHLGDLVDFVARVRQRWTSAG